MKCKIKFLVSIISLGLLFSLQTSRAGEVQWQAWSDNILNQARESHRLIIIDLFASWCQWCQMMDRNTYHDPEIINLIQSNFIAIKIDQDQNPEFSQKFQVNGAPITIIMDKSGQILLKRLGYLESAEMSKILENLIKNPVPENESISSDVSSEDDGTIFEPL